MKLFPPSPVHNQEGRGPRSCWWGTWSAEVWLSWTDCIAHLRFLTERSTNALLEPLPMTAFFRFTWLYSSRESCTWSFSFNMHRSDKDFCKGFSCLNGDNGFLHSVNQPVNSSNSSGSRIFTVEVQKSNASLGQFSVLTLAYFLMKEINWRFAGI